MRDLTLAVIDFETTGIPSENDHHAVVEAGVCIVKVDAGVVSLGDPDSWLVDPGRPIPHEAMAVHHITDDMVEGQMSPTSAALQLMGHEPDYFVAHNADFERQFFAGGGIPWLCTYKIALRLWPDAPSHSNQVLRYHLGLDSDMEHHLTLPAHRAGPDAYVTAHLLRRIMMHESFDLEAARRWTEGPALLPKVNFGKHKGAKWEDVPTDYLRWLAEKSDMGRNEKATAKYHLRMRMGEDPA
jgi:exodeoxyribonuclease X